MAEKKNLLTFLRSLIFNIYVRTSSVILFIILTPFLLFGAKSTSIACRIWGYNSIFSAKYLAGIDFKVVGEVHSRPVIFACKHQSAWETAIFHVLVKQPAYVFKKELLYIPIFNLFMLFSKQVCVDRKAGASSLKNLIKQVRARIAEGRHVIIFPEGTRAAYGAKPDYKTGIAALYSSVEADIAPVALDSGRLWARNSFWKYSGVITISFLPPIEKGLKKPEFMKVLEQNIENECSRIAAELKQ